MEEIINIIFQYVPLDYILIILGLIVIGEILKKFTTLPNYFLPTALPILGAALMTLIYTTSTEVLVVADLIKQICIGLLMGWGATGGYEWFKNTFLNKEKSSYLKTIVRKDTLENNETEEYCPEENQEKE